MNELRARLRLLNGTYCTDPALQKLIRGVNDLAHELAQHIRAEDEELFPLVLGTPCACLERGVPSIATCTRNPMNSTPLNPATDVLASDVARQEVLSALDELLEAERAGTRVAMETGREITAPEVAALVEDIHRDEVRWCSLLMRTIKSFGATPSSATGAFVGKAMEIPDVDERLKFLNRGQAWVVRKLEALIPHMSTAAREDLKAMLQAHQQHRPGRIPVCSQPSIDSPRTTEEPPPSDASALVAYILRRFHEVHRRQLPELIQLANKVETVHAEHPSAPRGLAVLLEQMHSELLDHMAKEEGVLFPMLARGGSSFVTHPSA